MGGAFFFSAKKASTTMQKTGVTEDPVKSTMFILVSHLLMIFILLTNLKDKEVDVIKEVIDYH